MIDLDLTDPQATRKSLSRAGIGWHGLLPAIGLLYPGPLYDPFLLYRTIFKTVRTIINRGEVKRNDSDFIERIIEKGRDSGVEAMRIKLTKDQAAGLNLKALGAKSKASVIVGVSGETDVEMTVRYFSPQLDEPGSSFTE